MLSPDPVHANRSENQPQTDTNLFEDLLSDFRVISRAWWRGLCIRKTLNHNKQGYQTNSSTHCPRVEEKLASQSAVRELRKRCGRLAHALTEKSHRLTAFSLARLKCRMQSVLLFGHCQQNEFPDTNDL